MYYILSHLVASPIPNNKISPPKQMQNGADVIIFGCYIERVPVAKNENCRD